MPKFGPFLPNIEESLEKILEYTQLTPSFYFDRTKFHERFYTTPAKDKDGNKYILKVQIEDYPKTKEIFGWERFFVRYFSEKNISDLHTPKFIESGELPPEWMTYKFAEGQLAGTMCGLYGTFAKTFPIESAVKSILALQSLTPDTTTKKETKNLYKNEKLINNSKAVLTHGDFHPGNIIVQGDHIAIIDWAYIHLNNYLYDITFLWLTFHNHPQLQERLLAKFKELSPRKENFDQMFKINLQHFVPRIIKIIKDRINSIKSLKEKAIFEKKLEYFENFYKNNL